MKKFLIFSTFVCFSAAKSFSNEDFPLLEGNQKLAMEECAREYNVDEKKYLHGIDEEAIEKYTDETSCMLACNIRKMISKELTGSDPKETVYNAFKKLIKQAYQSGFDKEEYRFTREEVSNEVEKCYASAKNECDFVKCTKFYDGSLLALFFFNEFHPVENPVFSYQ